MNRKDRDRGVYDFFFVFKHILATVCYISRLWDLQTFLDHTIMIAHDLLLAFL